jgi:acyl carrier protein
VVGAQQLRDELKGLLVKKLRLRGVAPESIADEEPLLKGPLGLDSIDVLELALAIEQVYGVKITDEQLGQEAFQTIAALAEFVERHRPPADASPGA